MWFGTFGWQIIAASHSIVITYIGHPEWVPVYSCTLKLSALLTQLGWVLPDSGLIGLAQLRGEQPGSTRLADRVGALIQLHLLLAGASVCGVLAFNPAFVTRWVGGAFFAGLDINAIFAVGIVTSSLVHGCMTAVAVLGRRLQVGVVPCAIVLGHRFGLRGIAAAALLSTLLTTLPAAIHLVRSSTTVAIRSFVTSSVMPWLLRATPLVAVAATVGIFHESVGVGLAAVASIVIGLAYVWQMRPLYQLLPLDPRWARWLVSLRLMPQISTATMEQS